jgi:predicted ATPase
MSEALLRHDEILRTAIEAHNGHVFKTVGDAFHATFSAAPDALEAALDAQRALLHEAWAEETGPLRVRMALHTGAAEEREGDYFGPSLNRVARLLSTGHGGQVLLSLATQQSVGDRLPQQGGGLRDLGERRLKDLSRPERIFQLIASGLPASFPPLKTLDARRNNLPTQPTPLVGRKRELDDILAVLRSPNNVRLLTLTGPGGTGKTRLGLQAAAELTDEFEDGVFFVTLAAIADPALVAPTIARTLGLTESANQPPEELLEGYLSERQTLLLLDNFEHLLESAPLLDALLSSAPNLKILLTSRTPLKLYGENEFPVPPLSLPDPGFLPPVDRLTHYEAVRLFVDRAKAVRPDFALREENALAVVEICRRLDGLPLAIELAAARIKLLPPRAMLDRLGDRLKLLTGGARNLPERQRTLRSAIEWSYELLEEAEKTLFRRLAVFSGGSTLETIEAVCDARGDLPIDVLDGVSSLLDNSLLRQEDGAGEEPRFVMLQTIHEYASERLAESSEAEELRRLHAEYFTALAEQAEPGLQEADQESWLERLDLEHDNIRAALSWAIRHEEVELALRLGGALQSFWYTRGHFGEGRGWLEQALTKDQRSSKAVRIKALEGLSWLANEQGDLDRAEAIAEEGLELSVEAGIEGSVAASLRLILGEVAERQGDHRRAQGLFEDGLKLHRQSGDRRGVAWALGGLGNLYYDLEDYEQAMQFYEEGLTLSRELGGTQPHGDFLISLGYESLLQGDYERAAALNEEAAVLFREHGRKGGLELALDNLGWAALLSGDHQRAKALHEESLALCRELGNKYVASESLEGLACIAVTNGEAERAATLFGAAEALREAVGYHQAPRERALREPYLASARASIEQTAWEESWEKGRMMIFREALSYAVGNTANG